MTMKQKENFQGLFFISPFIIGCILFLAYPLFMSIKISFSQIKQFSGLQKLEWVGFANYVRAFVLDIWFLPMFLRVVSNTLINTPLILIFSLLIAILLNKKIRFRGFFRAVFFLPFMLGTGYVLQQLLGMGVEQEAMEVVRGIVMPEEIQTYFGPVATRILLEFLNRITLVLWKSGVQILLFLSGLQGISISLYESAKCDSATEWEMFWKITLPMISPVILLNCIYTIIDSFTDITNEIVHYFYYWAFTATQFDYASAIGWIYFTFILLLIGLVFLIMKRMIFYAGQK
jgi:ABC-type sugar transport system permease subunit